MKKPPIFTPYLTVLEFFPPWGDYDQQAQSFIFYSKVNRHQYVYESVIWDYDVALNLLRLEFTKMAQNNNAFGGLKFINFSPVKEDIERMSQIKLDYDTFATWQFDLIENQYSFKWSLDKKNSCIRFAMTCDDERSPNYRKMVFFRHREPYKCMLMAYYYDQVLTDGVWEGVDTQDISW